MNAPPLETIPEHLREYITEQDPALYTPMDHAAWRYVMRVSKKFFSEHAHPLYMQGLTATGISTEHIPRIQDMDNALRRLGWRAVAINGFIPPAIFLEFQSLRILAIACDMRKLENLGYTPSPDIIHEAAGHAPIVADPGYRKYLEAYGDVARNAIISKYDMDLYEAIFHLSEVKENPTSTQDQINAAQKNFETIAKAEKFQSEAALLTRMAWWTTEYGLFEHQGKHLIYGAGLLSSVSESFSCLRPEVKKIPFSLEAVIKTSYDITRPQPQLFVTRSFDELTAALEQFSRSMAFRRGGTYGLEVAKAAENTVTVVLDTGIQISGIVQKIEKMANGEECAFTIGGTKQLAYQNQSTDQLTTHSLAPSVYIPLFEEGIKNASMDDIIRKLHGSGLHTKSGQRVTGRLKKELKIGQLGKVLVMERLKIVDTAGKTVFEEFAKPYPLIIGSKVTSVFGGAADRKNFVLNNRTTKKKVASHRTNLTAENAALNDLYQQVRTFRERNDNLLQKLDPLVHELNQQHPNDWLLRLELLEIYERLKPESIITAQLRRSLDELKERLPLQKEMIQRGISLI